MQQEDASPAKKKVRRRTSIVWTSFIKDASSGKVSCKHCDMVYSKNTATATLRAHRHACGATLQPQPFNQRAAEKLLTQWLLANNIPAISLDCSFFRLLMKSLQSEFMPPGRTKFAQLMTEEGDTLRMVMKKRLGQISHFCLSFDGWSSLAFRGYLGLVVHGIDTSWKLQTFLLALKRVTCDETGEYIATLTEEVKHPSLVVLCNQCYSCRH